MGVETKEQSTEVLKTANVFVNDTGSDVRLYGVSTKTASPRARVIYSLYLLNGGAQNPEDGELLDRKVGYYEYAGFHRQKLNGEITIKAGETLAVVAEETVTNADAKKLYQPVENGLYLIPLQTLNDFLFAPNGVSIFYNGQCVNLSAEINPGDELYYAAPTGERSEALTKYGYP